MVKQEIVIGQTNADFFISTPLRTPGARVPVIRTPKPSTFKKLNQCKVEDKTLKKFILMRESNIRKISEELDIDYKGSRTCA